MGDLEPDLAVLLVDISGSTALYESVGNTEAMERVNACLSTLRQIIEGRDGRFVSSKGDDVLATFDNSQRALDAAIEMHEAVQSGPLSLHAGIDYGPVISTEDDVFGDSVNMAARLATLAKSGEVLCSQSFFDRLEDDGRSKLSFFDTRQFKGKAELTNVYLFSDAIPGQMTQFAIVETGVESKTGAAEVQRKQTIVKLAFKGLELTCNRQNDVTIGRSSSCDLVVSRPWVSRSHATLEVRQDHAYLRDTSTSGTYILFDGQAPILARRETVLLPGSCALSLVKHPQDDDAEIIRCDVDMG